ncbi:MAG TPA: DUF5985 family protein [Labilithrix sp.]|jgi:hypothetical protein|nr:DUF5985 family protein [Labilithrix sp.]
MNETVYVLCAITSLACAILLVRSYLRSRSQLLLWSSVCFVGLFVNNVLLVVDEVLTKSDVDLLIARDLTNAGSAIALVIGLIWTSR